MTNNDGIPLSSDLHKIAMPPFLTAIMLDYLDSSGLKHLFNHCVSNAPRSFKTDITQSPLQWDIRRRPLPSSSDMYWISPANYDSHYLLVVLAYRLLYQPKQYYTKNVYKSIFPMSNANSDGRFGFCAKNCVGLLLAKNPGS